MDDYVLFSFMLLFFLCGFSFGISLGREIERDYSLLDLPGGRGQ